MSPPFDLIERYFDEGLTSEQETALEQWLRADREHLRIFLREIHLSQGMRDLSLNFQADKEIHQGTEYLSEDSEIRYHWVSARDALAGLARNWRRLAFGGAFALLLLAGAWLTLAPCKLSTTSSNGVQLRRGGSEHVVHGLVTLRSGDIISTESSSRAVIQYDWGATRIEVGGGTSVEVQQMRQSKLLRLNAGSVHAAVAPQRFGSHLEFITPQAQAKILGTHLKLVSLPDRTELEVYSGKVSLAHRGKSDGIQVGAGFSGVVADGQQISANGIPSAAGWIVGEYWGGIPGATIVDLTTNDRFLKDDGGRRRLENFETPLLLEDNYGARVRGYLHPPRTGEYKFWVAGDDAAELWLSPDDDPTFKQLICYTKAPAITVPQQWETYSTQRSNPIHLIGGRKYYIEALLKQAGGNDGLAVAWQGPDINNRQIIAGAYLSPVSEQK